MNFPSSQERVACTTITATRDVRHGNTPGRVASYSQRPKRNSRRTPRKESAARQIVTSLVSDPTVDRNDPRVSQATQDINTYGNLAEQDRVFVLQFGREPDREYQLSLGDVVYFGLI